MGASVVDLDKPYRNLMLVTYYKGKIAKREEEIGAVLFSKDATPFKEDVPSVHRWYASVPKLGGFCRVSYVLRTYWSDQYCDPMERTLEKWFVERAKQRTVTRPCPRCHGTGRLPA